MTYEEHSKRESAGAATKTPLISVVVPCCNVEKYVAKCIESILAQTYRNLEILLVDDCSTDATLSILRSYEGKDRRIRVIARNQNGGRSECRNSGILEASGDLIAFVDGDDTLEPNAYQTIVDRYDPSIDVYWFGIKIIYESNLELKKSDDNYYRVRHSGLHAVGREDLLDYDCSVCNKVFRRSVLGEEFLFKGLYYEDALFFMKFFAFPRKIYFFPEKDLFLSREALRLLSPSVVDYGKHLRQDGRPGDPPSLHPRRSLRLLAPARLSAGKPDCIPASDGGLFLVCLQSVPAL